MAKNKEVLKIDELTTATKLLIVMVGLPYSGKSTVARECGSPIVCPDAIRVALHGRKFIPESEPIVWAIARYMVKALFLAGHNVVVLDATNTTRERRKAWISKEWSTIFRVIGTEKGTCIARARACGDEDIIPIIEKMAAEFEDVRPEEGVSCER